MSASKFVFNLNKMAASKDGKAGKFFSVAVQFTEKSKGKHYVFVKHHQASSSVDTLRPPNRTLYVANLPPYCSKECLERLFGGHGKIENVIFNSTNNEEEDSAGKSLYHQDTIRMEGYKSACIVFSNSTMADKTMKQLKLADTLVVPTDTPLLKTGLKKWCAEYISHRPDPAKLQEEIDEYMRKYDERKQKEEEEQAEEAEPDDEGWVTVTKKSHKNVGGRTEKRQLRLKKKLAKKREQTELINFYSFQMRQSKREHIAELRRKFEEDKKKIADMKAARKFRPY